MTFSICVQEQYEDDEGADQYRFGVAVTTRLAGVGTLCPFVSENGAVATQSLVNVDLGRKGIEYIDDGLAVEDALQSLLNADDGAAGRQLHGVDRDGTFAFSGEECKDWFGHLQGDGYTVAGNLLVEESVIEETAAAYENGVDDAPLVERLIDALEAGHAAGGDRRTDLHIQSAAVRVATTEEHAMLPLYNDLRVDASETPILDLRATYERAVEGYEAAAARYEDAYEEDEIGEVTE